MIEKFYNGPRVPYPNEVNINSAHVLIEKLGTSVTENGKINPEEIVEALEMIKTLEDLQRDLTDGPLQAPEELGIAIAQLRDLKNRSL